MNKTKVFSLVGFLGAVGTATALIGSASGATGAYFSSTSNHTLSSSTGHLTLNTDNPTLNFSNLVPGVYSSLPVDYNVDSSTPVDLWLQFPTEQTYDPFTGAKNSTYAPDGGLGGYGHFAVTDTHSGQVFISNNLENQPAGDTSTTDTCAVNSNGDGGSDAASLDSSNPVPYCGVPKQILLATNLPSGASGTVSISFGVSGKWTAQNFTLGDLPFNLVATQAGVAPTPAF